MTLAQIMKLALRQLDEDPEDISEYDDLFRVYANQGYKIATSEYVRPRDTREMRSDEDGIIYLDGDVRAIIEIRRKLDGDRLQRNVMYDMLPTGDAIRTAYPDTKYLAVCEIDAPEMEAESDEPVYLPAEAHSALADYICFRHLSNGNMAKQSKAQFYQTQFYQAMQRVRPQGFGSVRNMQNLYIATDIRWTR